MKTILTASAAVAACFLASCTTHEYPPTTQTTVYVPAPKPVKKPVKVTVKPDTPENTTVVRPAE